MVVFYYLYYYYYLFRTRPSAELRYPVRADHPKGRRAFTMGANGGSLEGSKYPAIWRMSCRTLLGVPGSVPHPQRKDVTLQAPPWRIVLRCIPCASRLPLFATGWMGSERKTGNYFSGNLVSVSAAIPNHLT